MASAPSLIDAQLLSHVVDLAAYFDMLLRLLLLPINVGKTSKGDAKGMAMYF